MYPAIAIFAAVLGLIVTGSAVYTAWYVFRLRSKNSGQNGFDPAPLFRWTGFDYALLALVLVGLTFLLADVIGVMKERESYPYYHYGYLLSGFVFTLLGLLFLLTRLFLVLRLAHKHAAAPNQHYKPDQAHHAE